MINRTSNTTEITIQNLQPYSQYSCTVAAFTIAIGPASIVLTFTLPEAGEWLMYILFSSNDANRSSAVSQSIYGFVLRQYVLVLITQSSMHSHISLLK